MIIVLFFLFGITAYARSTCEVGCVAQLGFAQTCCYVSGACQACIVEDCQGLGRVNEGPGFCPEKCVFSLTGFHLLLEDGCPLCTVSACNTKAPSSLPTLFPTSQPTHLPTQQPTRQPTRQPTSPPVTSPTIPQTPFPTRSNPTTPQPTRQPTHQPTSQQVEATNDSLTIVLIAIISVLLFLFTLGLIMYSRC